MSPAKCICDFFIPLGKHFFTEKLGVTVKKIFHKKLNRSLSYIFTKFGPDWSKKSVRQYQVAYMCKKWTSPLILSTRCHFRVKIRNGLAAIGFLVLAPKPLVISKNFTSQTPLKIKFWSRRTKFWVKISKDDGTHSILGQLLCVQFPQNPPCCDLCP